MNDKLIEILQPAATKMDPRKFAATLVVDYAKFDKVNDNYDLKISDIGDFDLIELARQIMLSKRGSEAEATGPDNELWEVSMLPSFIRLMSQPNSKQRQKDFAEIWLEAVTSYFMPDIEEMLARQLEFFNEDMRIE